MNFSCVIILSLMYYLIDEYIAEIKNEDYIIKIYTDYIQSLEKQEIKDS